jgi:outer membrane protein TolC
MRCCCVFVAAGLLTAVWGGSGWGEATPTPPTPLVGRAAGGEGETAVFTPEQVVALALGRDALVRDAQQGVVDAQAALGVARAHIPQLRLDSGSSASSSAGLDPQSEISGTDFSSQYYNSAVAIPFVGGLDVGLTTTASTSTTNSTFREGSGERYTFAGAGVGLNVSRPLPILRNERVLTEGNRWSAELTLQQAGLNLQIAQRQAASEAICRFFAALRAQRQVDIARASLQDAEELQRIAEEKLCYGKLAEVEVLKTKVSTSSARVAVRSAESGAATAFDALKDYLGVPLDGPAEAQYDDSEATASDPLDEEALVAQALAERPDLQQLALGIGQAKLAVRQTEARSRPGVILTGGYSLSGQAPTISESWSQLMNPSWMFGVATAVSLNRSEDRLLIEQARGHLELARLNEQLQRDSVRLEIRRIVRTVQDAAANASVLAEAVAMAEESVRVSQTQFEHGLIRPIDVMEAERQLLQARNQHLEAVIAYQLARADLTLALGEIPYADEEAKRRRGEGSGPAAAGVVVRARGEGRQ